MMKYIVVHKFKDLQDDGFIYKSDKPYPHDGVDIESISKERIEELSTTNNKIGKILIRQVEETTNEEVIPEEVEETTNEEVIPEEVEETTNEEVTPETSEETNDEEVISEEVVEEKKEEKNSKSGKKNTIEK